MSFNKRKEVIYLKKISLANCRIAFGPLLTSYTNAINRYIGEIVKYRDG